VSVLLLPFSSLLGAVGIGLVAIAIWQRKLRVMVRRPMQRGLGILSVLLLLSSALASKQAEAWLGLVNFLPFFPVFAALSELIQTPAQLRRLAWILVAGSLLVVLIGFGQLFWGWAGFIQILWIVVHWQIDPTGTPPGRMASIFSYATVLASYLVITLILSLGLWVEAIARRQKTEDRRQKRQGTEGSPSIYLPPYPPHPPHPPPLPTLSLLLLVFANAIALVLTNSRNAWAIAILACLGFGVYRGWRWLLAAVGVVAGGILGAAFFPAPLRDWLRAIVPAFFWVRLTDQLYPDRPYAQLRTTQWEFALSLSQQRPWTGWGLRNFSPIYTAQMQYWVGHPHNLFLMLLAETGVPATLLLVGLVAWIMVQGVNCCRRALHVQPQDQSILFTYLIAFSGCILFNLLDIPLFDVRINLLGWLLLSAICGVVYHEEIWSLNPLHSEANTPTTESL
jgi:O-antigen ligase